MGGLAPAAAGAVSAPSPGDSLRVMTFNVMYEPALAGGGLAARWPLVVELLREADADVIGLQEVMIGRVEPLNRALPGHRLVVSEVAGTKRGPSPFVWVILAGAVAFVLLLDRFLRRRSRVLRLAAWAALLAVAGAIVGQRLALVGTMGVPEEHLVLAYRPDRLRLVDSVTMWLSPTPLRPGSHGTFDTGPHIALYTRFYRIGTGDGLVIVTTHVGHSPLERSRAARVLRGVLDSQMTGAPQILLGDLNATPDNPLLGELRADGVRPSPLFKDDKHFVRRLPTDPLAKGFRDAWTEVPRRIGPATTYHWSRPQRDFLPLRIDYVLLRGWVQATSARVVGRSWGKVVASDHDALVVDVVFSPPAR